MRTILGRAAWRNRRVRVNVGSAAIRGPDAPPTIVHDDGDVSLPAESLIVHVVAWRQRGGIVARVMADDGGDPTVAMFDDEDELAHRVGEMIVIWARRPGAGDPVADG
jgi:hypothetical protein